MIALLFGVLLTLAAPAARAEGPATDERTDERTYARLFGPADGAPAAIAAEPAPSAWGFVGPTVLLAAAAGGAWLLKRRVPALAGARPIDVVGRQPLGDRGALVLVDVIDAEGERRRLLVGTGGGPPTLVADLGLAPPTGAATSPADASVSRPEASTSRPDVSASRPGFATANVADEVLAERRDAARPDRARPDFARVAARHGLS